MVCNGRSITSDVGDIVGLEKMCALALSNHSPIFAAETSRPHRH